MRGVFLDFATVSNNDVDLSPLRDVFDELVVHDVTALSEIPAGISGFDVVLTNKCRLTRETIESSDALKLICLAATGFNNIDIAAARERKVAVTNIRAYCTPSVVQHVFTLMLALNQHTDAYRRLLREGAWKKAPQFTLLDFPIHELSGKMLGIVGHGELGSAVAKVADAFGMQVVIAERKGATPRRGRVSFDEMLRVADVISLHCPLTPETEKMFNADVFEKMKPTALLINTSRGAIVDEAALAEALRAGRIGGAGIDVLSEEPPVNGNPLLDETLPNLIVTPHIAWAAVEARNRAILQMADCVGAFMRGEKLNRVD